MTPTDTVNSTKNHPQINQRAYETSAANAYRDPGTFSYPTAPPTTSKTSLHRVLPGEVVRVN